MLVGVIAESPASACPVPVFRYALENWAPTVLDVVVLHTGPLTPEQSKLVQAMTSNGVGGGGLANIAVRQIDVDGRLDDVDKVLVCTSGAQDLSRPWMTVRYRRRDGSNSDLGWPGPLTPENVKLLLDSPVRRQVVSRIFRSDSVVWVVVDGGNKTRDDKAAAVVAAAIAEMNAAFVQPASQPDVGNGAILAGRPGGPPLRLALSMIRISADDPAERVFVAMLRHTQTAVHPASQPDEAKADEPIAIPIFGRGRTLGVVREADLTGETVQAASDFLCGECSCQAKEQAGGLDLLIAADWESAFSGEPANDAPPLRGLGAFLDHPQTQPEWRCGGCVEDYQENYPRKVIVSDAVPNVALWLNIILSLAGLAAVGAGLPIIIALIRRKGKNPQV